MLAAKSVTLAWLAGRNANASAGVWALPTPAGEDGFISCRGRGPYRRRNGRQRGSVTLYAAVGIDGDPVIPDAPGAFKALTLLFDTAFLGGIDEAGPGP